MPFVMCPVLVPHAVELSEVPARRSIEARFSALPAGQLSPSELAVSMISSEGPSNHNLSPELLSEPV